ASFRQGEVLGGDRRPGLFRHTLLLAADRAVTAPGGGFPAQRRGVAECRRPDPLAGLRAGAARHGLAAPAVPVRTRQAPGVSPRAAARAGVSRRRWRRGTGTVDRRQWLSARQPGRRERRD